MEGIVLSQEQSAAFSPMQAPRGGMPNEIAQVAVRARFHTPFRLRGVIRLPVLSGREKREEKMNMVIGTFYNEPDPGLVPQ